jgi:plastocyanin
LSHRSKAAFAAAIAVLVVPASASAATKVVDMGTSPAAQKQLRAYGADVNDFFPHGTTIHVGDSVRFVPTSFHTVDFPNKGGKPVPFAVPTGTTTTGVLDAAGAPFWFNGQPQLGFNPMLVQGGLGKKFTYTGAKRVESGLPLSSKPKPMTVKFPKAGTYTYFCDLHPGMTGTVRVVAKSHRIPSAGADKKALKAQIARDVGVAKALTKTTPGANTVDVGSAGKYGVEVFAMLPATTTVAVGTTVKFQMTPRSFEAHTATFGPGDPEKQTGYLGEIEKASEGATFDPRFLYPSDAPGTTASLSPALHGNGFWSSGGIDSSNATPLPTSNQVTFGAPGTYTYYCLIHPFMKGTVVVK